MSYDFIRYELVPPVFVVTFTASSQIFALHGRGDAPAWESVRLFADWSSTLFVSTFFSWAYFWLKLPGPDVNGPPSTTGYEPKYKDNGFSYYIATSFTYCLLDFISNFKLSLYIYEETPQLLATLSLLALLLCLHLYLSPSDDLKSNDNMMPAPYIFYRGRNHHPRLLGVDVKQLTNCRIGMMAFQLFEIAYFTTSIVKTGEFSWSVNTTLAIHTIYLFKFFCTERKYFFTIDILLDRAGYYLCWGCIVWVPCFFAYNSYFMVRYKPVISDSTAIATTLIGIAAIIIQTMIDRERHLFRFSRGKCKIWGKEPKFITATYIDHEGNQRKSLLLTSGFWGTARHLNYAAELVYALCVCIPCYGIGFTPFLYFIFILVLLVHRVFRDEEKCRQKYGRYWNEYCKAVPYRIVPLLF